MSDLAVVDAGRAGVFTRWSELPVTIQHAVAAALLRVNGQAASSNPRIDRTNPAALRAIKTAALASAIARTACRAVRDGVDGAATTITASHVWNVPRLSPGRFPSLTRLDLRIIPRFDISMDDMASGLRELRLCAGTSTPGMLHLAERRGLRSLQLENVGVSGQLDGPPFPSLQRLALGIAPTADMLPLLHLRSCVELTHLDLGVSEYMHHLDAATLQGLSKLQHLQIRCWGMTQLDVPSCSPTLTHLSLAFGSTSVNIDLFLPGGVARSSLQSLTFGREYSGGKGILGWDLRAVPNLTALELNHPVTPEAPLPLLDFQRVPHLRHLVFRVAGAVEMLDLSVCAALTRIEVQDTHLRWLALPPLSSTLAHLILRDVAQLRAVPLEGCTALHELYLHCIDMTSLDLTPVSATLQRLDCFTAAELPTMDCSACNKLSILACHQCPALRAVHLPTSGAALRSFHARGCTQLTRLENLAAHPHLDVLGVYATPLTDLRLSHAVRLRRLDVSYCKQLTTLDLSACTALRNLQVNGSGLAQVDVGQCGNIEEIEPGSVHIKGGHSRIRRVFTNR